VVITQPAHRAQGLLLRGVAGQYAGFFQALVIAEYATGGLHHVLGLLALGLVEVAVDLVEH